MEILYTIKLYVFLYACTYILYTSLCVRQPVRILMCMCVCVCVRNLVPSWPSMLHAESQKLGMGWR